MKTKTISPREQQKDAMKKRIDAFVKKLPHNWIILFVYEHPEYDSETGKQFLSNLRLKRSLSEKTIGEIEAWVEKLKTKKKK